MSLMTANPNIDLASEQQPSIYYLDDGTAIFKVVSDPNGLIIANAGSMALQDDGTVWIKSANNDAVWTALSGGGGGTPGAPLNSVQYNDAGAFAGNAGFIYDPAALTNLLIEPQVSNGVAIFENGTTPSASAWSPFLLQLHSGNTAFSMVFTSETDSYQWSIYRDGFNLNIESTGPGRGFISWYFQPEAASGAHFVFPNGHLFYSNSATYYGGIGEIASDKFALMLSTGTVSAGTRFYPLTFNTNQVGINATTPLASFHVNAANNTSVAGLFIANAPTVDVLQVSIDNGSSVSFGIDLNGRAYSVKGFDVELPAASTATAFTFDIGGTDYGQIVARTNRFNFVLGGQATLDSDTDGFVYIPGVNATPTGIPTNYANTYPIRIDIANDILYYYNAGWISLTGAGGSSPGGSPGEMQWNDGGVFAGLAGSLADSFGTLNIAPSARSASTAYYFSVSNPADLLITSGSEAVGLAFDLSATRQWDTNGPAVQREFVVYRPTYSANAVTSIARAATMAIQGSPVNGTNLTVTSPVTLWLQDGPLFIEDGGAASDVALQIAAKDNGFYGSSTSILAVAAGVALTNWSGSTGDVTFKDDCGILWGSSGLASADTGLWRQAAAVTRFGNQSTGGGTWSANANVAAQITGNVNNYQAGLDVSYLQLWSSDASRNVTGYGISQVNGQVHLIVNNGAFDIVLTHLDAGSSAANQFQCSTGANITLTPGQAADIIYNSNVSKWFVYKRN